MPVKWDSAADQLLLLKILETVCSSRLPLTSRSTNLSKHNLKVDAKAISEAWPADHGLKPTARAITERLVKIRQNSKAAGAGHFGISSSQNKSSVSAPSTPSKSRPSAVKPSPQKAPTSVSKVSPTKRKRTEVVKLEDDDDEDDDLPPITPSKPKAFTSRLSTGQELADIISHPEHFVTPTKGMQGLSVGASGADADEEGSPTKRPRRTSAERSVPYEDDGDAGAESDVSEFRGDLGLDGAMDDEVAV